jgi:antirestriction protein
MTSTPPRLYVGTYAKYNNGSIKCAWLDLEDYDSKDDFLAACAELHKDEADPEFMFQDFEGFPRAFYNESFVTDKLFEFIQLDEYDRSLVAAYVEALGADINDLDFDDARDAYAGQVGYNESEADFAEQRSEELGDLPKDLPSYIVIDWEATWNCNLRYDYMTHRDEEGTLWFFHNC